MASFKHMTRQELHAWVRNKPWAQTYLKAVQEKAKRLGLSDFPQLSTETLIDARIGELIGKLVANKNTPEERQELQDIQAVRVELMIPEFMRSGLPDNRPSR